MNVNSVINLLNNEIKLKAHESWDNSGLQIGSNMADINKIMLTLDLDLEAAEYAVKEKVDLIITHHPFFFSSIKKIDIDTYEGMIAKLLIRNNINLYSLHTSYDMAEQGVTSDLAKRLKILNYEILHKVNTDNSGYGGIGAISPVSIISYAKFAKEVLNAEYVKLFCNDDEKIIKKVAFCGGSGGEFIDDAINLNADLYITGDIKYHQAQKAIKSGLCIIDAGHYKTEINSLDILYEILEKNSIKTLLYKNNMTKEKII